MLKGTQRRLTIGIAAIAALGPALLMVRPASAFPPGHAVSKFNYKFQASTHIAKLKKTIAPPSGAFTGGVDMVTNQLRGGFKLPNSSFDDSSAGLTNVSAALVPTKPFSGRINRKTRHITATSTFVMHIVTASRSTSAASSPHLAGVAAALAPVTLPPLPVTLPTVPVTLPTLPVTVPTSPPTARPSPPTAPPVNLVGDHCQTAKAITMTLKGSAQAGSPWKFTGTFTLPKFVQCGTLTGLLNSLLSGPGNTFSGVATPNPSTPTETFPTLPGLPITIPSLPITLPSLPITLPSLPVTLPTVPVTLPTLPVTVPTLPVTLPTS
jgi:hypothetical protein